VTHAYQARRKWPGVALEITKGAMANNDQEKTPNPVDLYVGGRVRMRRRTLGFSQEKLAEDLGLTFQQVQKYERGANRVSASKLYEIARSLSAPISFFFEGLSDPQAGPAATDVPVDNFVHDFLMTNEGVELASLFPKIKRARVRRRLLELVRTMAEEEAAEEG
jgi:transcriptional regulator with XRE-family HTH domain